LNVQAFAQAQHVRQDAEVSHSRTSGQMQQKMGCDGHAPIFRNLPSLRDYNIQNKNYVQYDNE
jgi:hypothetical protein